MLEHCKGCLVCGEDLVYGELENLHCSYCHRSFDANVKCTQGHYVCDECHSAQADDAIDIFCSASDSVDPLKMAVVLMRNEHIKMHGPEHHFLVPAVLLTAYYNTMEDHDAKLKALKEARSRASNILGGFCGFYGDCGAAVGTGIFVSIITNSTPLSRKEWRLSNLMTATSLFAIAKHGGPRCCKRNSFLAIHEAVEFLKENFDITLNLDDNYRCEFTDMNKECLKRGCPFYPSDKSPLSEGTVEMS